MRPAWAPRLGGDASRPVRPGRLLVAAFVALTALACDSGPSGPGTLPAIVVPAAGQDLGAVVLAVTEFLRYRIFSIRLDASLLRASLADGNVSRGSREHGPRGHGLRSGRRRCLCGTACRVYRARVDAENRRLVSLLGLSVTFERP